MEQDEKALADFNLAIKLDPELSWMIAYRGQLYRLLGQNKEALKDLNRAIELDSQYAGAIATRGLVYQAMYRFEKAIKDFNQGFKLNPELIWTLRERGNTYRLMEKYEKAIEDFNEVIEINPNNAKAFTHRGQSYVRLQRYQEAIADFNRAIEIDETLVWVWGSRGQTYLWMGEYEKALTDLKHSIELAPDTHVYCYLQFLAYQMLNRPDEAQKNLAMAIELIEKSNQGTAQDWLDSFRQALYYMAKGNRQQAEDIYQQVLSQDAPKDAIRLAIRDLTDFLKFFPNNQDAKSMQVLLETALDKKQNE